MFPKTFTKTKINFISAAFSEDGRKFAIKNCDILFTMFSNLDTLKKNNNQLKILAKQHKRNILVFSPIHVVCKKSRSEAQEFYEKYSKKCADLAAVDNFNFKSCMGQKIKIKFIFKSS